MYRRGCCPFIAGKEDVYFGVTMPQLKDVKTQLPQAICDMTIPNVSRNLLVNRDAPPFDNARIAASDDVEPRPPGICRHHRRGTGNHRRGHAAAARGRVGNAAVLALKSLPGYDPDVASSRAQARTIMEQSGLRPRQAAVVTVATRNVQAYRDAAVILISQLKEIYIDAELNPIDTTQWYPMLMRKDYKVAVNVTETAVDDPDVAFYENYVCGAQRNYTGYCNCRGRQADRPTIGRARRSEKRKKLVWEIERKLIEDDARPILFYTRAANCREPYVKGLTTMVNSIYNAIASTTSGSTSS